MLRAELLAITVGVLAALLVAWAAYEVMSA